MRIENEYAPALHGLMTRVDWSGQIIIPDLKKSDWYTQCSEVGFEPQEGAYLCITPNPNNGSYTWGITTTIEEDYPDAIVAILIEKLPGFYFKGELKVNNCPRWILDHSKPKTPPPPEEELEEIAEEVINVGEKIKESQQKEFFRNLAILNNAIARLSKENHELKQKLASDRYLNTRSVVVERLRRVLSNWWTAYDLSKGVAINLGDMTKTSFQAGNLVQTLLNGPDGDYAVKLDSEEISQLTEYKHFAFIIHIDRVNENEMTIHSPYTLLT